MIMNQATFQHNLDEYDGCNRERRDLVIYMLHFFLNLEKFG